MIAYSKYVLLNVRCLTHLTPKLRQLKKGFPDARHGDSPSTIDPILNTLTAGMLTVLLHCSCMHLTVTLQAKCHPRGSRGPFKSLFFTGRISLWHDSSCTQAVEGGASSEVCPCSRSPTGNVSSYTLTQRGLSSVPNPS
jgi:hypothetical protein